MNNRTRWTIGLLSFSLGLAACNNGNGNGGGTEVSEEPFVLSPIFVSAATGADDADCGLSWADSCATIQAGSDQAVAEEMNAVFVAAGTYFPAAATESALLMATGIAYYGGFVGTEAELSERPDPSLNPSVLDGDFAENDPGTLTDNSLHVVIGASDATLDGFTVRGGFATASAPRGGGMLNESLANLTISNVVFNENRVSGNASAFGGAIYNRDVTEWTLSNVDFTDNGVEASDTARGGAIYSDHTAPSTDVASLSDVRFEGNEVISASSQQGGAMYMADAGLSLSNVTFEENSVSSGSGGALHATPSIADIDLANVSFTDNAINSSGRGGALFIDAPASVTASLTNVDFERNRVRGSGSGGAMYASRLDVDIRNSRIDRNEIRAGSGGGLHMADGTLTLSGVSFERNSISRSGGRGGALGVQSATTTLNNVAFTRNSVSGSSSNAAFGGGASISDSTATLSNVRFRRNEAFGSHAEGGGLAVEDSTLTGTNIHWIQNGAEAFSSSGGNGSDGGAVAINHSETTLTNVDFSDNNAQSSAGEARGAGLFVSGSEPVSITNTTFAGNGGSSSSSVVSDALYVGSTGNLSATNLLFGDNQNDVRVVSGATVTLNTSCSDADLSAIANATVGMPTQAMDDPTLEADTGDRFIDPTSACVNTGNSAVADSAYAPDDWRDMTAQLDRSLDTGLVDPGMHYALDDALWIESIELTPTAVEWVGNFPSGTSCTYTVFAFPDDIEGVITGVELISTGTILHGATSPVNELVFECDYNGLVLSLNFDD